MRNRLLISRKWFWPALIVLLGGAAMAVMNIYGGWELSYLDIPKRSDKFFVFNDYNLTNEVSLSLLLIGLIALSFMKVKNEDEFVYQNRLMSWQWSVLINYFILFVANWVLYGGAFWSVMLFSMVSIPVIFLLRFYIVLFRLRHYAE